MGKLEKIKNILNIIVSVLGTLFFGFTAIFLFRNNKNKKEEINKAEQVKEDKKNELEKKSPDDIVADSPNPDVVSANIEREQEEFRERVRNRLNKNIHRTGSTDNN